MSEVQNNAKSRRLGGVTGAGFRPGQSGNPGGRPKVPQDVKAALKDLEPRALEVLRRLLDRADSATRLRAASMVLERLYGRPNQPIEQHLTVDQSEEWQQLRDRIVSALQAFPEAREAVLGAISDEDNHDEPAS